MQFVFEQIRTGGDRNFAYLIGDRAVGAAAIIDPSYAPDMIVARADAQKLRVEYIINTHGHVDHTNGNSKAQALTGAHLVAHGNSRPRPDLPVDDEQLLELGSYRLEFLHVPGHSNDHIVVYLEAQRVAVTGDHLFVGKIGGTATEKEARTEFESLRKCFNKFPDDVTIWPGHDYGCRPSSTIALEKVTNPFVLRMNDIDEFLRLKRDWGSFKIEQGLI